MSRAHQLVQRHPAASLEPLIGAVAFRFQMPLDALLLDVGNVPRQPLQGRRPSAPVK